MQMKRAENPRCGGEAALQLAAALVLGLGLMFLPGCGEEPAPDGDTCNAGLVGCACGVENFCQSGAYCGADGVCAAVSCELGSEGCACFANGTCAETDGAAILACDADGICRGGEAACPPGTEGCGCVGGGCLGADLVCVEGEAGARCELAGCTPGEEGCTCPSTWQCGVDENGGRLACDGTRCVAPRCEIGEEDCWCGTRRSCDAGLSCSTDTFLCEAQDCVPGAAGCGCDEGVCVDGLVCGARERCVLASCGEGADGDEGCACVAGRCGTTVDGEPLGCVAGVCVAQAGIRDGAEGGSCYPNSTCNPGMRCDAPTFSCVACTPGTTGCDCRPSDGGCATGLACFAGSCVAEEALVRRPPADPVCYSPCSNGLDLPDGSYRSCSAEGLMAGCLGGLDCVNGSCVGEGVSAPTCASDLECPDFQTCIESRCYSECEFDSDCGDGLGCYRKVCRVPCTSGGDACGAGQYCNATDGPDGYCMVLRDSEVEPATRTTATFTVSPGSGVFSSTRTSIILSVTNESGATAEFVVRKVGHLEYGDAGVTPVGYEDADGDGAFDDTPLHWLRMGADAAPARVQELSLVIDAGETRQVTLAGAANEALLRWDGVIEIVNEKLGRQRVRLEYSTQPDGQWTGTAFYFVNFDDTELDDWLADRDNNTLASRTNNALLAKWTAFRTNSLFALEEMLAVINATVSGAWDYPSVRDACQEVYGDGVERHCYLYASSEASTRPDNGIRIYTADVQNLRIPTGAIEMPFSMNLRTVDGSDGMELEGRINTSQALQFPGNPAVSMRFATDPASCARAGACVAFVDSFASEVHMGARYVPTTPGDCGDSGLAWTQIPWLLSQFTAGTSLVEGSLYRGECRENRFPVDPGLSSRAMELNASLAAANPIPDGNARVRRIELVDGMYVNQDTLLLLVRETFDSYFGLAGDVDGEFSAYGILSLRRTPADITDDDYLPGLTPAETVTAPDDVAALTCDRDVIREAIGVNADLASLSAGQARSLAVTLINGVDSADSTLEEVSSSAYDVHYLCHDTGRFNGGPTAWASDSLGPEDCPYGSGVTYFLLPRTGAPNLGTHACQTGTRCGESGSCDASERGTCDVTLRGWIEGGPFEVIEDPGYVCLDQSGGVDADAVICTPNRENMRESKRFYVPTELRTSLAPLREAIDRAFRYKTRFRSRTGETLGFVPELCEEGGDALPYCYDPEEIEAIRGRVDCLLAAYSTRYADLANTSLGANLANTVRAYLETNFSFEPDATNPEGLPFDGFERLYAELLIMLGDDAYTRSLASRFDLAGTAIGGFDGDVFEPDGIRLSGGAGYQMRLLYASMQYQDLVLDRFYRMAPTLWQSLASPRNFVNIDTIATYFNRVLLASTRKARVASEVARQYHAFNRADLARHVIERAYSQTYLESIALSQFVQRAAKVVDPREVPAVQVELENIQRSYRVAMQRMREVYQSLTDELSYFGLAPDYIPFPVLRYLQEDGVNVLIDRALETLAWAREREDRALESTRAFDTDAARFQAELVGVRNLYENDLARICGTFTDRTGNVYPAIPKYATVNGIMTLIGNPCGYVGNGQLYDAMVTLERSNGRSRSSSNRRRSRTAGSRIRAMRP